MCIFAIYNENIPLTNTACGKFKYCLLTFHLRGSYYWMCCSASAATLMVKWKKNNQTTKPKNKTSTHTATKKILKQKKKKVKGNRTIHCSRSVAPTVHILKGFHGWKYAYVILYQANRFASVFSVLSVATFHAQQLLCKRKSKRLYSYGFQHSTSTSSLTFKERSI